MLPSFRILVVEDFEPFRRFIRLALQARTDFEIVGEAEDGLDAIQKARDLQPDLILMDIGLPKLNGLDAARQILQRVPQTRILFVTLESSRDAVQGALMLGAHGYVYKERAHLELLPAMDAVIQGRLFQSAEVDLVSVPRPARRHDVQFYSDDRVFLESASSFASNAMNARHTTIMLATRSHQSGIIQKLEAHGFNMDLAIQQGFYIAIDAIDAMTQFMVDGQPDCNRFSEILGKVIQSSARASQTGPARVAIFGECAGMLCSAGNSQAAIKIEKTGNEMMKENSLEILCAYPLSAFQGPAGEAIRQSICAEHTAVYSR